ncbi:putative serine/threonine-protein kinase [Hordeum vulgare]|nr:putative serine/threonine-protein kinase [Hordeum vulgare]
MPATSVPMSIDLNAIPMGGASSSGGARKRQRELPTDAMGNTRNIFDRMPAVVNEANHMFTESIIFEGGAGGISFNPDETQSQDGRSLFMASHEGMGNIFGEDNGGTIDPFMEDQLGMGSSFLLEHEFPEDLWPR